MSQEAALDQADVCLANGDPSGAERVLLQAFPDIERASADAQHAMAMVRLAQGNTQQAERLMRAALMVEPNSLRHNIALGHILAAQTNDTGALAAYTTAERIDPKWPGLNVVISHSLYRLERYSEAEQAARRGAAWSPTATACPAGRPRGCARCAGT